MEQVINRMYEIEEKANSIIDGTAKQKKELLAQHNEDIKRLKIDIDLKSKQKLSILRANMDKEIQTDRKRLIDECAKDLKELEDNYKQNHDSLVENIFMKIIS